MLYTKNSSSLYYFELRFLKEVTRSALKNAIYYQAHSLESVIDVGQGISVGPGRFGKKTKRRALNKHRAWKIWKKE